MLTSMDKNLIRVSINYFIRGDMHFDSFDALKVQLAKDKIDAGGVAS